MAFPESFLQELADRNDIVDVVSAYVRLTKRSGANLFGLCPFHSEKTPSFSVSPDKQIYHCFGCGKGGSVINFIMEIENLSFPDAVEFLARRAGMEVPDDGDRAQRDRRGRLLALNKEAARFFYGALTAPEGRPAQEYIQKRQIDPAVARRFGLGFAPDSFYALTDAMHAKGYQDFELIDAGLANANKNGRGVHDVFRNRLMFPVIDVRGSVIGFSGRILGDGEPKYLNSRETPVFSKSRNLFALNLAKKSKNGYILLTEGNIDVVSLHQAGFDSAVASLGTSLTPEQARLISRYSGEVVIAYDNDAAGQKAAQRAIGILEQLELKVKVLKMTGAKDPDEFIKAKGRDAFANLLQASENHVEYRLAAIADKHDLQSDEGKVAFLKEASELIAELPSPVEREVYAMRVAEKCAVSKEVVTGEAARVRARRRRRAEQQQSRSAVRELRGAVQPKDRALQYENTRSALAEEGVVRLMYLDPALLDGAALSPEEFSSPMLGRLFGILQEKAASGAPLSMAALSGSFTPEEVDHITALLQKPEVLSNGKKALSNYIDIIRSERETLHAQDDLRAYAQQIRNKKGMVDKHG
ncbi:MAG: DNA primase [Ruminococcaceae bacterium]|nr:DNA primase [Oscillospiraceae bacterium]